MDAKHYIEDLKVMIQADAGHLATALVNGDRTQAHRFVDAIIDNRRILEDLEKGAGRDLLAAAARAALGS